jgi:nucleoside 2-deoxyribosyltransferase
MGRAVVHLAGPSYSPEEVAGMEAIATTLEGSGFEVYLRSRDGLESALSPDAMGKEQYRSALESAAYALEIFQLVHRCDCLVFNMNGRVPDDEGAFLAAVAFGLGKPVILYKRDHRTELSGDDNAMIPGLSFDFGTVRETEKIPGEISRAMERYREPRGHAAMAPLVELNADLGRAVWESLRQFKTPGSDVDARKLCDELAAACEASEAYRLRTA